MTSIAWMKERRDVEMLIKALNYEDVRSEAVQALGELGDRRAVQPLVRALRDPDENYRWRAALALGNLGDHGAIKPLVKLLGDDDAWVRKNAVTALIRLDGLERAEKYWEGALSLALTRSQTGLRDRAVKAMMAIIEALAGE